MHIDEEDNEGDGWDHNRAHGIRAGRPDRLMSQVTVNGMQVLAPNAGPAADGV